MAGSNQGVGQRDTELAGQMVVANAPRAGLHPVDR